MENSCKILCFGDSLTAGYAPLFEQQFKQEFPDINSEIINTGVGGETSRDGLRRISNLMEECVQVVLIGFGMNDLAKGVSTVEFANNLSQIISFFDNQGTRVLLLTMNPVVGFYRVRNAKVDTYNQVIKDVAHERRIRIVDINSLWKREIKPWHKGLKDSIHPNELGYELYCKALLRVIPRRSTIILWQYNGNPAECNYRCPYCSYDGGRAQKGHYFQGTIEGWRDAFKDAFGNQHLVFYFGHGEPMIGKRWFDVIEMIGAEPNWEMRVISNMSSSLTKLLNSRVAKEGRLNINASFHPVETTSEEFLQKLLQCREYGIEVPVVYTLWLPYFERFESDFKVFNEHRFLIHVRRFRGLYEGKKYPEAYTESERRFIARYADDATIKYMLSNEPTDGKLAWIGVDFMIIDNEGNVGYCDDYRTGKYSFGNIFNGNVMLLTEPKPFPKGNVSDGTVDGVACILELGYRQLEGNHIFHFARQGGVYHISDGVFYKNMHTDFNDPCVRAEYYFPPRNIVDCYYILRCRERSLSSRVRQIVQVLIPGVVTSKLACLRATLAKRSLVQRIYRYLQNKTLQKANRS